MADIRRQVSIRLSTKRLSQIDAYCEDENRSDFMGRCAMVQARLVIRQKAPHYVLRQDVEIDAEPSVSTTTISLSSWEEATILQACEMLHQRLSTFIVWATMAEIEKLGGVVAA